MTMYPSNAYLERILTDEFKRALAEESAERIVERFGPHVLKRAEMGLTLKHFPRQKKSNRTDKSEFIGDNENE